MSGQSELRIVVQFIAGCPSEYRLIAYGNVRTFPALSFSKIPELMQRLEAAGIAVGLRPQADGPTPNETKVVYSANVMLNDAQLRVLGWAS